MPKFLVIVESPTKARTIARFVDDDYIVESSIGHIRDLPQSAKEIPAEMKNEPWSRLGIDVENQFRPLYVIPSAKKSQVTKLKGLLKDAERLYLATDEDREGESISWHLMEVLKPKVPTHRLVFHEITREAIQHALQSPREIDDRLVTAQETRRVLDRLYGYEVSPVLWRKIAPHLSAGRVQSVAVRLIVNRERERLAFRTASYWDLAGDFAGGDGQSFKAVLATLDGKRLVTGKDFEDTTGKLAPGKRDVVYLNQTAAEQLRERLGDAAFQVTLVEHKPYSTQPPAPFTTSTLQQEANRKFGQGSRDTMRLAQALYEKGYITYMRTDSTTLSDQALQAAREQISSLYGAEYLPGEPRRYASKVKNAQEAHEAIRPAGERFRTPDSLKGELEAREWRLFEMIWKRTVASQMPNARGQRIQLNLQGEDAVFQASGKTIEFPGFLRAYVEGSDDPDADLGDQERILPPLREGQPVNCGALEALEHTTQPKARFSEASLIKELEKEGIGRPSTYASIIDTIIRREYVIKKGNALVPTFTAIAVVRLLEQHFTHLVDLEFTAHMESVLDAISRGEQDALPYLERFYNGNGGYPGLKELIAADIDPREACTIPLGEEDRQNPINVRIGRYGPYLESGEERATLPANIVPDELTPERARELLKKGSSPEVLGNDPKSGMPVYLKTGRYGPYVQLGDPGEAAEKPKMKSLFPEQEMEQVTLEDALRLLSLPRIVGIAPDDGEPVLADLGRYGPYIKRGKDTRTLPSAQAIFTLTMEEAETLFRQEKTGRRGGSTLIRELGKHPENEDLTINLMTGRYGPYVTDGDLNASVPRAVPPEDLTLEAAMELLRERAAKAPVKSRAKGKAKGRAMARKGKKTIKAKGAKKAAESATESAENAG